MMVPKINITRSGNESARPLVFLHGFGADRFAWIMTTPRFEAENHIHVVELPGHGASQVTGATSPKEMAQDVLVAMRAASIDQCDLVAHSLGGAVAIELARAAPDLIKNALLIAPAGFGTSVAADFLDEFVGLTEQEAAMTCLKRLVKRDRLVSPQMADHVVHMLTEPSRREYLRSVAQALKSVKIARLPVGFQPILIWGEDDEIVPLNQPYIQSQGLVLHVLPQTGHLPQFEAPQKVNRLIAAMVSA